MIKIAIVEDNEKHAEILRQYIERFGTERNEQFEVERFDNGMQFISEYSATFDIVFMDIEMPVFDGISTARKLRELDNDVCLIFVTNLAKYALFGYEVSAMDYMVKPVKYFNFAMKLEKAVRLRRSRHTGWLMLKIDESIKKIDFNAILFVEVFGHTAVIHTDKEALTIRMTLGALTEKLPKPFFFQCNRSVIINLKYLSEVKDSCAVVGNQNIKISRSKMTDLLEAMAEYSMATGRI